MNLSNFQQTGFQRTARIIQNTAVFDKQRQVPFIVDTFHPANAIAATGKFIRADRLKRDPRATFDFRFERLYADALQCIFGFRVFTIGTVTPVALGGHYRFSHGQRVLQRDITKFARGACVSFLVAVFDGQTAAHQQVKANQLAVFRNRHEVHVVGVQIDIILRRNDHRGFKFTRQIGLTQNRLDIGGRDFFLIEPDLRIRAGARQQVFRDFLRPFVRFGVQL
ncbi:hypothetical protein D3C80_1285120 [compost metagenome]